MRKVEFEEDTVYAYLKDINGSDEINECNTNLSEWYGDYSDASHAYEEMFENNNKGKRPNIIKIVNKRIPKMDDLSLFAMLLVIHLKKRFLYLSSMSCSTCYVAPVHVFEVNDIAVPKKEIVPDTIVSKMRNCWYGVPKEEEEAIPYIKNDIADSHSRWCPLHYIHFVNKHFDRVLYESFDHCNLLKIYKKNEKLFTYDFRKNLILRHLTTNFRTAEKYEDTRYLLHKLVITPEVIPKYYKKWFSLIERF